MTAYSPEPIDQAPDETVACIPLALIRNRTISNAAIRTYAVVALYADEGVSRITPEQVGALLRRPPSTVRRALDDLVEFGWIALRDDCVDVYGVRQPVV